MLVMHLQTFLRIYGFIILERRIMKINIVFNNNGYGLKKDALIISKILRNQGHSIFFNEVHERDLHEHNLFDRVDYFLKRHMTRSRFFKKFIKFDVNIFLEVIVPHLFENAYRNIFFQIKIGSPTESKSIWIKWI